MKYILFLLGFFYILGGIYFLSTFLNTEKKINIDKIKDSIVIIIPEKKLINYNSNPKGLFKNNQNSGIGLGFFINKKGKIQTVNHIVSNTDIKYNILYKNKYYSSKIISRDEKNDLAILEIISKKNTSFNFLKKEKVQNKVNINKNNIIYSFGVDTKKLQIIYNTGTIINKNSKLENMSNLLEISNILRPGFSGGPIINYKGKVIGINYAISEGKKYGLNFLE